MSTFAAAVACGGDDGSTDDGANGSTGSDPTGDPTGSPTSSPTGDPTGNPSTDDGSTGDDPSTTGGPETGGSTGADDTGGTTAADDTAGSDETAGVSPECQNYCDLFQENCSDGPGGADTYDDDAACYAACADFSEEGLMCRTGHLDGSLTGNPPLNPAYYETHCQHADIDGSGVCMD
ncbi:MAG TPA: hypothetical protein VFG69_15325 [Nannocystaceae bacterium]|nr:hypothetical protein [Nannocystaceae bacterium]